MAFFNITHFPRIKQDALLHNIVHVRYYTCACGVRRALPGKGTALSIGRCTPCQAKVLEDINKRKGFGLIGGGHPQWPSYKPLLLNCMPPHFCPSSGPLWCTATGPPSVFAIHSFRDPV